MKDSVGTETASADLALTEQSTPQLCAPTKGMCVRVVVTPFLCDVYVAMNTGVFLCSHSTKNTFQEKIMSWLQSDKSCNGELLL